MESACPGGGGIGHLGLGLSRLSPPGVWLNILRLGLLNGFALDQLAVEALEESTSLRGTAGVLGVLVPWKGGCRGGEQRWLIHRLAMRRWSNMQNKEGVDTYRAFMAKGEGIVKSSWGHRTLLLLNLAGGGS